MDSKRYKPFDKWDLEELENEFNLKQSQEQVTIDSWFAEKIEATEEEHHVIKKLRKLLHRRINSWNESELNFRFIAPIIDFVDFEKITQTVFLDRQIVAEFQKKILVGELDLVVSTGRYQPKEVYFCIHMHKRERGKVTNPLADLIITMFATYINNESKHTIYGAYVVGRQWFLVTLNHNIYEVSRAFDISKKDIFEVFACLKGLKKIINDIDES